MRHSATASSLTPPDIAHQVKFQGRIMAKKRKKKKKNGGLIAFLTIFAAALTIAMVLIVTQVVRTSNQQAETTAAVATSASSAVVTPTAVPEKNGDTITGIYYDPNTARLSDSAQAVLEADGQALSETAASENTAESETAVQDASASSEAAASVSSAASTVPAAAEGSAVYINTTSVNVRSEPNTDSTVLGQVSYGTELEYAGEADGWTQVIYNNQTGYVKSDFISTEKIEQTSWNLDELDSTPVNFGYSSDNLDENNVPTDWEWYENKWGQFNVDWIQDTSSNTIYLTMDEGYGNDNTIQILDTLAEKGVKVVFFLTKNFVDERPELVQRMIDEGHQLGNHTCTHPDMTSLSIDEQTSQIMTLEDLVEDNYGYKMKYFRYPEGIYSDQSLGLVNNLGLKVVFWSYAYVDYDEDNQPPVDESLEKALNHLHPGAIYLLHAKSDTNTAMLADFIDGARERGFEFGIYPED